MQLKKRITAFAVGIAVGLGVVPSVAFGASRWERIAGRDAYETMKKVVQTDEVFTADTVDTVIVATSEGYWDALAAAGLAGVEGAPVLITSTDRLASNTYSEIYRLKPSRILVMGGRAAVSDKVFEKLGELAGSVERVAGPSAPDTAVEIYNRGIGSWGDTVIVATSTGYWDALSIAPFAYSHKAPIFLTSGNGKLPDSALAQISGGSFTRAVIVGGKAVVSPEVEGQLAGLDVTRLAGIDALGTSAAIAQFELANGMHADELCVATTNGYWDALTGASLAGKEDAIIVLANPTGGTAAIDTVVANGAQIAHGRIFGGRAAVSDENMAYIEASVPSAYDEPLEITESGWFYDQNEINYAISIKNNDRTYKCRSFAVIVSGKDKDGNIIVSNEKYMSTIRPLETITFADDVFTKVIPDSVDFIIQSDPNRWNRTFLDNSPIFELTKPNEVREEYRTLWNGEIAFTADTDLKDIRSAIISVILRDKSGRIVGGYYTYQDVTGLENSIPFTIGDYNKPETLPEYSTFEFTATNNSFI